ncbi:MAG TPA: Rne/Rng family ribonuclease [Gammaproteobacteria bacterium]|nr:Rne/Rng family ribonuclease [Gammaproteobacteria bacterium]
MSNLYIDALYPKYPRVALTNKQNKLEEIDLEQTSPTSIGSIYAVKISSVEPSLDAAFVKFDHNQRHGFLPFKEIDVTSLSRYKKGDPIDPKKTGDLIKVGDPLLVQIKKEERDQKGAAVSTFISLAGSYLVALPNNPQSVGVSTRVDNHERQNLRDLIEKIRGTDTCGLIIRTAGVGKSLEELQWDYETLIAHWNKIKDAAKNSTAPRLIHQESDPVLRAARDYLTPNIDKIITNDSTTYDRLANYIQMIRPEFIERLEMHTSQIPLFTHYSHIEESISKLFERIVPLPNGGEITIDPTEALTAIDVNSKRATHGSDIEQTALETNLQAAEIACREIRLRKISGIIAIDFIDMNEDSHKKKVENIIEKLAKIDRARVRYESISPLTGVMSLSRQRIGTPIHESHLRKCTSCEGKGVSLSIEGSGIKILRKIYENASSGQGQLILVQASTDTANYLLNELRNEITFTENKCQVKIIIVANNHFENHKFTLKRFRLSESDSPTSYDLNQDQPEKIDHIPEWHRTQNTTPAVSSRYQSQPPQKSQTKHKSLWKRILDSFGTEEKPAKPPSKRSNYNHRNRENRRNYNQKNLNTNQKNKTPTSDEKENQPYRSNSSSKTRNYRSTNRSPRRSLRSPTHNKKNHKEEINS